MRKKSPELQWLEIMSQRNGLDEKTIKVYQRFKRGYQGEIDFDHLCQFFLKNSIGVENDLTLSYQKNTIQIDKLLTTEKIVYLIDVKYYRGHYVFENNEWRVGNSILPNNIYEQLRRAVRIMKNIFREAGLDVKVQGALAFINPESTIEVIDSVQETTLSFNQIPGWLIQLGSKGNAPATSQWKSLLQTFEIEGYRTNRICDNEMFNNLKKGIRCTNCGSFNLVEDRFKVSCSCGWVEVREQAYVRTICEYGVIMHDKEIRKIDLNEFFQVYDSQYMKRILKKHFVLKDVANHNSTYYNKSEIFEYWFSNKNDYFKAIENRKNWKTLLLNK